MKKRERNLDEMIEVVKEHHPTRVLLQRTELVNILSSPATEHLHADHHNQQSKKSITMTIVGSLIVIGTTFWWFVLPGDKTPISERVTSNAIERAVPLVEQNTELWNRGDYQFSGKKEEGSETREVVLMNREPEAGKKPKEELPKGDETKLPPIPGYRLTDLTDEELGSMGVIRSEGMVSIEQEKSMDLEGLSPSMLKELDKLGYNTERDEIRYHYNIAITHGSSFGVRYVNLTPTEQRFPLKPVAILLMNDDRSNSTMTIAEVPDSWSEEKERAMVEELGTLTDQYPDPEEVASHRGVLDECILVQIPCISTDERGELVKQNLYIWYPSTSELLEALPKRYRTKELVDRIASLKSSFPDTQVIPPTNERDITLLPGTWINKRSSSFPELWTLDRTRDIKGVTMIELQPNELERLDIQVRGRESGFKVTMEQNMSIGSGKRTALLESLGYEVDGKIIPVQFELNVDTFNIRFDPKPSVLNSAIRSKPVLFSSRWIDGHTKEAQSGLSMIFTTDAPVLTELKGEPEKLSKEIRALYMWNDTADGDLMANLTSLNQLVPVRVNLKSDEYIEEAGQYRGAEILLWYVPTPEFITALPERYRDQLKSELDAIASVEAEGLPSSEVCNRIAGETILDVCRSSSGAIVESMIWPNPVRSNEQLGMQYHLREPRKVTVTLHDLAGRFVRELVAEQETNSGTHEATFSLDGITEGPYLVALRTNKGETAVQRIVVK